MLQESRIRFTYINHKNTRIPAAYLDMRHTSLLCSYKDQEIIFPNDLSGAFLNTARKAAAWMLIKILSNKYKPHNRTLKQIEKVSVKDERPKTKTANQS